MLTIDPGSLIDVLALCTGTAAAALSLPGSVELLLLTVGALLPARSPRRGPAAPVRRLAVVVPAHDEAAHIARCVRSLRACPALGAAVDVVVVADNCSDDTAARAVAAGATVLERTDPLRRGKGHALRFAFERLLAEPIDAVAVVDADSVVEPGMLATTLDQFAAGAEAVQVPYGVRNPADSLRTRLMSVALLAFNRLRPRGRAGWGLSAGILGNGFALRRETLLAVPYEATSVVEDLEYHLRLVAGGRAVAYADGGAVLADMPTDRAAATQQRARWEGGRLRMLVEHAPGLARAVCRGRFALLEPLLELLLLPLALHGALVLLCLLAPWSPLRAYGVMALALIAAHVGLALGRGGGSWRDLAALAAAPLYVAWKLGATPRIVRGAARDANWVRTARPPAGKV